MSVSGYNDNVVWGVNKYGNVFQRTSRGEWNKIDGELVQVAAGLAGVWGVTKDDEIFYRQNTYGGAQRYVALGSKAKIRT